MDIYSGGDGLTPENRIVINASNTIVGVSAEYQYLNAKHGKRQVEWNLKLQQLLVSEHGKMDKLTIELKSGEVIEYYFDIEQFYGNWK